jgi:hypothetical protein
MHDIWQVVNTQLKMTLPTLHRPHRNLLPLPFALDPPSIAQPQPLQSVTHQAPETLTTLTAVTSAAYATASLPPRRTIWSQIDRKVWRAVRFQASVLLLRYRVFWMGWLILWAEGVRFRA